MRKVGFLLLKPRVSPLFSVPKRCVSDLLTQAYSEAEHGRIHCLYSVGKAIARLTGAETLEDFDTIAAARDKLLYSVIWKEIAQEGESSQSPFLKVETASGIRRIGIREAAVSQWIPKLGLDFQSVLPLLDPVESSSWSYVGEGSFSLKSLRSALKSMDTTYKNKHAFDKLMHELNQPMNNKGRFVAIDIQPSDVSPNRLTEIGIVVWDRRIGHSKFTTHHFLIDEHKKLTNRFLPVEDRKKPSIFRPPEYWSTSQVFKFLKSKLARFPVLRGKQVPVFDPETQSTAKPYATLRYESALLVTSQTNTLKQLYNADLTEERFARIHLKFFEETTVYDVQRLYSWKYQMDVTKEPKLRQFAQRLGIDTSALPRTAVSNAYAIMLSFMSMIAGHPVPPPEIHIGDFGDSVEGASSSSSAVKQSADDSENEWSASPPMIAVAPKQKKKKAATSPKKSEDVPEASTDSTSHPKESTSTPESERPSIFVTAVALDANSNPETIIKYFTKEERMTHKTFRKKS